ncbi:muscle M-line assembly protein unc-89-like isoform X22 [Pecten maximus]|uniref:muscle M-line assembly protein unc-89-like isoform X22 n=1 Tax=Pecten maximus TaxID=6579 RepID=UPI0014587397|nr:muscle M-line assembly protein unc-89-like isoform X22 [Pecten maximus]
MSVSTEILVCTSVRLTAWLEGVRAPLNSSCLVMDSRPLEAGATRTLKLSTQDHWVCQSLRETVTLCPLTPEIYLYQPPRLCKSLPQTMRVKEWQMLFFECKVEGFPKPTVTWLCNGEELTNKGHVKIIAVKNYHSCEIARAYAERDTGKFTVRLSHPSGSVIESSCEVEIQQDITLLSDLKEKKKSDLVLEREAKAEQLAAKYAKKAEEVTKSSKTETTESVTTVESEKVSAVEKTAEGTAAKVVEEAVAEAAAVVSKETVKEPAPSAETASAPVEAAPEPAPEPAPAAEPVPEPAPKSEAAPAPAAEPAPKPAPEPAPEPEAAPAPAAEPAPEPAPEPEAAPAPAAEPAPEPVPEPVPEPAPEPAAPEPAPVSEPVAEEATKADAAPEVAKEDEVDAAPQPEPCESSVPEEKEPAYVSPDFVTKLEKEYRCLDTDTNIKIQCQVEGKPLPEVSWVKDNKKLSPSENLTVEWNADSGISTLWFQSLTVQDSGKYTCIASSSAGSCSCSATFTVDTAAANLSLAGVKPERAPTVKKGLDKEYSFVTTDTKAKLQCEVDGHPTPDVLWKKDGKTLVNGSKHGIEWDAASGKATLKFKSLTEADSGCYECSASSTAGSVSSSANITVKKPEKKPTVVDALKKEYSFVETKETVRLQCKMEGNPCPEISWTKDGKALGASEQMTFEWNAKTGVAALVFKGVSVSNTGKYECVAKSSVGTTKSATTMTVKEPERAPSVVEPLNKEYNALESDENVCLKCKLDGNPVPKISWTKDGKKLSASDNVKMEWDAATCTASLVFKHPKSSDSGNYECVAKSSAGTTKSPTTLTIKKPDVIPTIQRPLEKTYTTVEGGESLRLKCQVDGYPSPHVTWKKDEKEVVLGDNVAMEWNPETGSAALVFKQPMCEDSGDYQCVATSPVGTTNSHTTLTVKKPEKVPSVVEQLDKVYDCQEGGDSVRLTCQVEGNPSPTVTWLKDGKEVTADGNIIMEWDPETGSAALVFKRPTCEDSGDYQCVAKSPLGTTNSHTTLTVKKVPTVVKPLNKAYEPVERDQNVRLVCKLDGTPAPEITWLKDGKKIVPGENVAMEWDPETGSAALVFKQPTCEDSGDYQCVAKSPLGTTNSHTTLSVKKVPTVVKPLDKAYEPVEGDQNVRLVCKLDGTPAPEITWLKDGKKVVPGENVAMEWDPETGSAALVFKQPMCEDSGDYQCVAKSPLGTTNSHTTLTVKKLPTIIEALEKSYDTVEGTESVRIVCKIDGRPRPEICWLKNGKEITPGDKLSVEWDTETGSAALVFKQPTCEDSGDYQCVATSSVGTTNTQTTLNVNKPPTMTKPLEKSYTCKAGDKNLRLACTVTGKPSPEVSWSKGGKKIKSSDDITIEWNATTGSAALVLKQPTYQDTGEYQCVATSPLGSTSTSTTIKVKKPEKKPAVVQPLDKEYNLTETKETITLTFKVDGNPVPEVSWLKDGKPLEAGGNISFGWNAETGSASLIFNGVSVGDSGKYECVATSTIGKTTSSTTIAVKKPEKKPTFSTPLQKENNKKEGDENFVMTCTVEGNPPPQVSWMKNGAKLEADDNISAQYDAEKGTASLTFKVLSCADAGNYECVAVSSAGTGKSKASLTVKSKKCFSPTTNQAFITSHQVPEIKPKFSKELDETYKVLVGDKNVTLACVVDGNPCPDVSWYKDGKKEKLVDTTNMKMKFDQSTGNASLIFSSVSLSDAGSYVCLADSAIGNKRSETSLKVTKPVCPPVFTDMATSQTVPVGGVAVFKCIVTSKSPATFTWKKGDKVLSSTDRIKISVSKTDTSLTITGVQFDDRATYTCSAKNEDGEEHTSGDLNVEEKGVKGRRTPLSDGPSSFIAGDEDDVFLPDDRKPKASYTWDTYVQDITILAEGHALYIADNINSDEESVVQHEHSNTNNVETANEEEYIVTLKISPDHYDSEMSHAVTNTEYGAESLEDGTTESNNSVDPTLSVQEENLPLSNHKRTQSEEMENDFESNTNLNGVVNKMELKELIQDCKTLKTEEGEEKDCTSSGHPESPVKPINFSFLINASPEDDSGEDSYSYEYSSESGEDFTQTLTGTRDRGYIDNIGSFERATLKDVEQVLPDNRDTRPGNRNIGLDDRDVGPDNRDTRPDNRDIELDDRIPIRNSEMLEEILEETVGGDLEEEAGQDVVDGAVESKVAVATESKSETVKVAETKSETTATQEVSVTKEEVKVVKAKSESVSKQEVSVKKEEAKVTQVTSESVSAAGEQSMERLSKGAENNVKDINKSTVQVLQELESSVSKLNETLSQTQETSVASSTSDSRIEIVEVTARHITNETSDEASEVRHRHHDHHGPEIIVPANSTKIPEHSEVELMVKVRAAKQANVRWMHEGEVVQQSERGYAMFVMLYILAYYIMLTRT